MKVWWFNWGAAMVCAMALGAGAVRGATLQGITPGRSRRAEMRQRFGKPVAGTGSAIETFEAKRSGLARIVLYYDTRHVVRKARLDPAEELTLDLAALLFDLRGKPRTVNGHPYLAATRDGRTTRYDADGVLFYVARQVVREIWLIVPGDTTPLAVPKKPPAAPAPAPKAAVATLVPNRAPGPPAPSKGVPSMMGNPLDVPKGPAAPPKAPAKMPPSATTTVTKVAKPPVPKGLSTVRIGRGAEPPAFVGIVVGRSERPEVDAALGAPRFVGRYAPGAFACEHEGAKLGLHAVVVRYRPDGAVAQIELRLEQPLPRAQVASALGLREPTAIVPFGDAVAAVYAERGVELAGRGDTVSSLRLAAVAPAKALRVTKGPLPAPPAPKMPAKAPAAPAPMDLGPRGVKVVRVWHQVGEQASGQAGAMVYGDVAANGCKGQQLVVTVRLRQHDGRPVGAAAGAPAQFADARRRFTATVPSAVPHPRTRWAAYRVFVPVRYLALPRGQEHPLIIVFTASCGAQADTVEAPCTLRVP